MFLVIIEAAEDEAFFRQAAVGTRWCRSYLDRVVGQSESLRQPGQVLVPRVCLVEGYDDAVDQPVVDEPCA